MGDLSQLAWELKENLSWVEGSWRPKEWPQGSAGDKGRRRCNSSSPIKANNALRCRQSSSRKGSATGMYGPPCECQGVWGGWRTAEAPALVRSGERVVYWDDGFCRKRGRTRRAYGLMSERPNFPFLTRPATGQVMELLCALVSSPVEWRLDYPTVCREDEVK